MRIVSLCPSNTEIVHWLGLTDHLVGVDDFSDYPPEVRELPRVGSDLLVRMEAVEDLQPDIVLASLSVPGMERNVAALQARGLPYIVLNPTDLEGVYESILTAGRALGSEDRALSEVARLRARAAAVAEEARRRREALGLGEERLLAVFWEWWPRPLISPGRHSWVNDQLRLVGARNVFEDLDATSARVEPEAAAAREPDAVCLCWCGLLERKMTPEAVLGRPGWDRLEAVRRGRVFCLPEAYYGRPGPRLVEGAERLVELFYPSAT
ncbi:MAG: cobalamin-binding protein [Clostridia bacterium]|nr:cobalamin-binding protein [Clostridia bacterium]